MERNESHMPGRSASQGIEQLTDFVFHLVIGADGLGNLLPQ